jgi:Asp-tRNA(Asn)/Glu-tRNA(Gln) amidotransferase A subunit family amidase
VRAVRSGALSSAALLGACAARQDATAELNAFVVRALTIKGGGPQAQAQAQSEIAGGAAGGALAGAPISIKANLCIGGVETTAGSRMLRGW